MPKEPRRVPTVLGRVHRRTAIRPRGSAFYLSYISHPIPLPQFGFPLDSVLLPLVYPRPLTLGPVSFPTYGVFAAIALDCWPGTRHANRCALASSPGRDVEPWPHHRLDRGAGLEAVADLRTLARLSVLPAADAQHFHPTDGRFGTYTNRPGLSAGLLYMTLKRMPWLDTFDAAAPGVGAWSGNSGLGLFFCRLRLWPSHLRPVGSCFS